MDELSVDASIPILTYQPMATDFADSIVDSIDGVAVLGFCFEFLLEFLASG